MFRHRWARHALSAFAGLAAILSSLLSLSSFAQAGWSKERTILYAAEGGLLSPREALMHGVLFGVAALIWFTVLIATLAPPGSRARWVSRATVTGCALELVLGLASGGLCSDFSGMLVLSAAVAVPMALVALALRRRKAREQVIE